MGDTARNRGLFAELKRRNVFRAGALYAAAAWALAQGIAQLGPPFGLPDWVTRWFVIACTIGFPFWIAFAWFYELTPQGIKRESEIERSQSITRQTGRKLDYSIMAVLAAAVVLLLTNRVVPRRAADQPAVATFNPPADSIVVLPFANLNDDPKQKYFSDGFTEELTDALGQNTRLTVLAWETASKFASGEQSPGQIGRTLNVAHILDGSIQREGKQIRISAELVSTVSGRQLWSTHYDDSVKNIFKVQDKISAAIAEALRVKFAGMRNAHAVNPQAYDWLLLGMAAMESYTEDRIEDARKDFANAIAIDPDYADAYANLGRTYLISAIVGSLPLEAALPQMRAAANRALALDPDNAPAWVDLGLADSNSGHIAQARRDYQRALALDPSNATAHLDFGTILPVKDGLAQDQLAVMLDPLSWGARYNLASNYLDLGEYRQVTATALDMIKISPQQIDAAFDLAFADRQLHMDDAAVAAFDLVKPTDETSQQLVEAARLTYQSLLDRESRRQALAALKRLRQAKPNLSVQCNLTQLYLALGEKQTALQMLPGICAGGPVVCFDLALNPIYAPLRGDPRFERLSARYSFITLQ